MNECEYCLGTGTILYDDVIIFCNCPAGDDARNADEITVVVKESK